MLQALEYHFWQIPYFLPLTLVFLGLFIALRVKQVRESRWLLPALLLVQLGQYALTNPAGYDLVTFTYNARLWLQGIDVFSTARAAYDDPALPYTLSTYLDYTPLQFGTYSVAEWVSQHIHSPAYVGWGWMGLHFLSLLSVLGGLLLLHPSARPEDRLALACKAIFLFACPLVFAYSYSVTWMDKAFYAAFALLAIQFWRHRYRMPLLLAIGFAYNGGALLLIPIYLSWTYRNRGIRPFLEALVIILLPAAGFTLLYGLPGLVLFQNRMDRIAAYEPGMYSLLMLLPDKAYASYLSYLLQGLLIAASTWLLERRQSIRWAVILAVWGVLLISPWGSFGRFLWAGQIVVLTQPRLTTVYFLIQALLLLGLTLVSPFTDFAGYALVANGVPLAMAGYDLYYERGRLGKASGLNQNQL